MAIQEPATPIDTPVENFGQPPSFEDVNDILKQQESGADETDAQTEEEAPVEGDGGGVEAGTETSAAQEPTPPPEPAPAPDVWEYEDGTRITREEAQTLAQFERWLQENPQQAEVISQAISGQQPQPAPQPQLPEGLDLEDPATAYLVQQLNQQATYVNELSQRLQSHESQLNFQQQANVNSLVRQAQSNFQKEYDLPDSDMATIHAIADRSWNVAGLVNTDPITGQARNPDAIQALEEAYKAAMYFNDEYRERDIAKRVEAQREDMQKKSKLSSLAGSSGSTPRTPKAPSTPQEANESYVNDVARAMNFPTETP